MIISLLQATQIEATKVTSTSVAGVSEEIWGVSYRLGMRGHPQHAID